jgi:hypothetical protein
MTTTTKTQKLVTATIEPSIKSPEGAEVTICQTCGKLDVHCECEPATRVVTEQAAEALATTAQWGTWKTHGNAAKLFYYGTDRKAIDATDGRLVTVDIHHGSVRLTDQAGHVIHQVGVASRFWAVPQTEDEAPPANAGQTNPASPVAAKVPEVAAKMAEATAQAPQSGAGTVSKAVQKRVAKNADAAVAASKAKPAKQAKGKRAYKPKLSAKPNECKCGCGALVSKSYKPGHDARHASKLRVAYEAGEVTREQAIEAVGAGTLLASKLNRSLDLADQRNAARSAK